MSSMDRKDARSSRVEGNMELNRFTLKGGKGKDGRTGDCSEDEVEEE